jgi:hypothetical protein
LNEADRRGDDQLAPACLRVARRQRPLSQEIEFPQEQPIIAVARQIDRFLVDQHSVDDAAHLNQLLPIATVAGEARDLPGGNRTDLAEADLRHHSLETGAHDAASGGAAEIVIDDLDLGPAESRQTLAHGVLQRPALAIMQDLMPRGFACDDSQGGGSGVA